MYSRPLLHGVCAQIKQLARCQQKLVVMFIVLYVLYYLHSLASDEGYVAIGYAATDDYSILSLGTPPLDYLAH